MVEFDEIHKDIRRLSFRLHFLVYRQAARRVLDLFRFGNGTVERLTAAMVIGALFFLVIILVSLFTSVPISVGLSFSATALVVAWATSAIFVFGKADEDVAEEIDQTRDQLEERRREAELLVEEADDNEIRAEEPSDRRERHLPNRRERRAPRSTRCPFCDEVIQIRALKCKHCGEIVDDELRRKRSHVRRRQTFFPLAAFLSWVFPGLGQLCKGQVLRGFVWWFAVGLGLCCFFAPGVVIWVLCIFDAAFYSND